MCGHMEARYTPAVISFVIHGVPACSQEGQIGTQHTAQSSLKGSRNLAGAVPKQRCRGLADWPGDKVAVSHGAFAVLQGKERYNFPNPNPFVEDDMDKNEIASVAYRYVISHGVCAGPALCGV